MSITSRISSMEEHVTNAYDELQGLGADLTNVNKNIENISMVLDDIYDSMPQVSGEGTSLTLDDTRVGKIKSTLKGNTSQDGTPTPSSPIPINVVSGDNEINVVGKNLIKVTNGNSSRNNTTLTIQDNVINLKTTGDTTYVAYGIDNTIRNANYGNYITWNNMTLPAGTYTLSTKYLSGSTTTTGVEGNFIKCIVYGRTVGSTDNVSTDLSRVLVTNSSNSDTFTTNQDMEVNIVIYMYANQTPTVNINFQVQLEKGSSASSYLPYSGNTYNIDLPEGMELCKIGNYQDYFYKDNGSWYLHKEIGKIVLDGTETWVYDSEFNYFRCPSYSFTDLPLEMTSANRASYMQYANNFTLNKAWSGTGSFRDTTDVSMFYPAQNAGYKILLRNVNFTTTSDFSNWLSSNNTLIYYPLATTTTTEITYQPLIDQLNLLEKAMSKEGQTNISQVNNDLPFIISASALKEWTQ